MTDASLLFGSPNPAPTPRKTFVQDFLLFVGLPLVIICGVLVFVVGSGRFHLIIGTLDTSTVYREPYYSPASEVRPGVFHGTHFTVHIPPGWQTYPTDRLATGDELVTKRPPVTIPGPVIVVSAGDTPTGLFLEPYVDIVRSDDVDSHQYTTVGNVTSVSIDGSSAQEYSWTEANGNHGVKIFSFKGGVVFSIAAGTVPGDEGVLRNNLRKFLSTWVWVDSS